MFDGVSASSQTSDFRKMNHSDILTSVQRAAWAVDDGNSANSMGIPRMEAVFGQFLQRRKQMLHGIPVGAETKYCGTLTRWKKIIWDSCVNEDAFYSNTASAACPAAKRTVRNFQITFQWQRKVEYQLWIQELSHTYSWSVHWDVCTSSDGIDFGSFFCREGVGWK